MKTLTFFEPLESRTLLAALCQVAESADDDSPNGMPFNTDNCGEAHDSNLTGGRSCTVHLEELYWTEVGPIWTHGVPFSTSIDYGIEDDSGVKVQVDTISDPRSHRVFLGKLNDHLEKMGGGDVKLDILVKRWSNMEDEVTLLQEKIEIAKRMGHSFLTHGYAINTGYVISLATPLVVSCKHSEFLFLQVNAASTIMAIVCAGLEILDHNFNEALGEAKIDAYEDAMESYDHTLSILDEMSPERSLEESGKGAEILEQKLQEFNSCRSTYVLGKELDAEAESGSFISKTWGYIALSSLGALFMEHNVAKVALVKSSGASELEALSTITRITASAGLASLINLSNNIIATMLFSNDVWSQYDGWGVHDETARRALKVVEQCEWENCTGAEHELAMIADLIYRNQRSTGQFMGMGWSLLKLTAAASSFVPILASWGFTQQDKVAFAQKMTTWGYLIGSTGFVAQGLFEAGLSQITSFLSPFSHENKTPVVESSLKTELLQAIDFGKKNEATIQNHMNYLLNNDVDFAIEYLLHNLAKEREAVVAVKQSRNENFKPWELESRDMKGSTTGFLRRFDNTISEEDLQALSHYSGELDGKALLRRRLHV